jgi:hypothetical protein
MRVRKDLLSGTGNDSSRRYVLGLICLPKNLLRWHQWLVHIFIAQYLGINLSDLAERVAFFFKLRKFDKFYFEDISVQT